MGYCDIYIKFVENFTKQLHSQLENETTKIIMLQKRGQKSNSKHVYSTEAHSYFLKTILLI